MRGPRDRQGSRLSQRARCWVVGSLILLGVHLAAASPSLLELNKIQEALQQAVSPASAATVGLDLGEGMSGSGVIISKEGLIMSAAHVTQEVGKTFDVLFEDGRQAKAVSLGLDSSTDASLAQILGEKTEPFPFVERRVGPPLSLGQWVFALGHSGGFDQSRGAVLRIGRLIDISSTSLKTDCTLIGGDSGGPLFDLEGRLIGIHSRVGTATSTNLHVPLEAFARHWEALLAGAFLGEGPFATPCVRWLGMKIVPYEQQLYVEEVLAQSPAGRAGVRERVLLRSIGGQGVKTIEEFQSVKKELEQNARLAQGVVFLFQDEEREEAILIKGDDES